MRTFPTAPSVSDLDRSCITVESVDRDWQGYDETTGDYREPYESYEPARKQIDRDLPEGGSEWIEVPVVASNGSVIALILGENKVYELDAPYPFDSDDYAKYVDALCDSYGVDNTADLPAGTIVLTEDELEDLYSNTDIDSAEGPMMNYSYDLRTTNFDESGYYNRGRDPKEMAALLLGLPLCVVVIDDDLHLALTGGGMDLSWEINEAYVRLGFLPPVAFDLPGMAGRGESEHDKLIIAAAHRSRVTLAERAVADAERFAEKWMA